MRLGDYSKRIISSIVNNLGKKDNNFIFIEHNNSVYINREDIFDMFKETDYKVLFYCFNKKHIQGAYAPFLGWIKKLYLELFAKDLTAKEFVDACNVYPSHRILFINFIENGVMKREEGIIFSEVTFEQYRFKKSILDIFSFISQKKNIIFILCNANLAADSTAEFYNFMIDNNKCNNLGMIVSYTNKSFMYKEVEDTWKKIKTGIYDKNLLVEYEGDSFFELDDDTRRYSDLGIEIINEDNVIDAFTNMICSLCFEQAKYYLETVIEMIKNGSIELDNNLVFKYFSMYAIATIFSNDFKNSIDICSDILVICDIDSNLENKYTCYYILCLTHIKLSNCSMAMEYAKNCIDIANEMKSEYALFKAGILYYMSIFDGWKHRCYTKPVCFVNMSEQDELIVDLKKYGFKNTLAYFYVYCFDNDEQSMDMIAMKMQESSYMKKALDLSYENQNYNFIIAIYLRKIIEFSNNEVKYHDYISFLHRKRMEIINKFKVYSYEECKYDHLGYNCMIGERYEQANDYFNECLKYACKHNDVNIIIESMYNLAYIAADADCYKIGSKYCFAALQYLDYLGLNKIHISRLTKIYGLAALCCFYINEEYNSTYFLSKIERNASDRINATDEGRFYGWDDELFLYYFVKALILKKQGNIVAAQLTFSKAEFHMNRSKDFMFFSYPRYAIERAEAYEIIGDDYKRKNLLDKCIAFCNLYGYIHRAIKIKKYIEYGTIETDKFDLNLKKCSFQEILEVVRKNAIKEKRVDRKRDIRFLYDWQEKMLYKQYHDENSIITFAMNTLREYYGISEMLYFSVDNNKFSVNYESQNIDVNDIMLKKIYEFFSICDNVFITNRSEAVFYEYSELISLFDMDNIMCFAGVPILNNDKIKSIFIGYTPIDAYSGFTELMLDERDVDVIRFVLVQLNTNIEKNRSRKDIEDVNNKLLNMAVTDLLTGLFNRQGFKREVEKYFSFNSKRDVGILYIDLDNFKFYNDTFGHDIGDFVLKTFAKKILNIVSENDIAVRYGGDEFIILIAEDNIQNCEIVAKSILNYLKCDFKTEMEIQIGKKLDIPSNKYLSCSIGISIMNRCCIGDIQYVINNADKALYQVKNNTKDSFLYWKY